MCLATHIPTGIIFGDGTLAPLWAGDPGREELLATALERLISLRSTRGTRLRVLPGSAESRAVRTLLKTRELDARFTPIRDHAALPLPPSFEDFLRGLGYTTRRNFRYYRRRSEAAGNTYVDRLSRDDLESAAWALRARSRLPTSQSELRRVLKMVEASERPFTAGLRDAAGHWVSVAGGCYSGDSAVMFFQLNEDVRFPNESLSLVLRSYLFESLILQGTQNLWFWAGVSPPLSRYAKAVPAIEIHLDKPAWSWRIARWVLGGIGPWLPRHMHKDARTVAPFRKRLT